MFYQHAQTSIGEKVLNWEERKCEWGLMMMRVLQWWCGRQHWRWRVGYRRERRREGEGCHVLVHCRLQFVEGEWFIQEEGNMTRKTPYGGNRRLQNHVKRQGWRQRKSEQMKWHQFRPDCDRNAVLFIQIALLIMPNVVLHPVNPKISLQDQQTKGETETKTKSGRLGWN